ncbi:NUDIX domain-containing protein [Spongiactinospora sp. TRM90649]|uniref:NUDIX domain-containing protein n=1 Tax=Spongiactinospora sp. TRM90649 TaxID=3031114 RepID=UPI0023F8335C|nr:NUDIX domain-containing protein [Spongiactinospora sp. TRM90649]MDF5751207.1 NUDIX domain-containing protein [Spongiactinospora sp. TRM90649]
MVDFAQKAIITHENKMLFIQKSPEDPYHPLKWEIPGGRMRAGESLDEHIRREVKEEVGLSIEPREPLAMWSWRLGDEAHAPTIVAVAVHCLLSGDRHDVTSAGQDAGDHIGSWAWIDIDKAAELDLIPEARDPILAAIDHMRHLTPLG